MTVPLIDTIVPMSGVERMTDQLVAILAVLLRAHLRNEELHGYELMKRARLSGPTTYRNLDRLEDARLVDVLPEEPEPKDRPRRVYYRLNPSGLEFAKAQNVAERRPDLMRNPKGTQRPTPAPRPGIATFIRRTASGGAGVK